MIKVLRKVLDDNNEPAKVISSISGPPTIPGL